MSSHRVVFGAGSNRSACALLAALVLPPDTKLVKRYPGGCVVDQSRWLHRVLGLQYIITGPSVNDQTAEAWASTASYCRG